MYSITISKLEKFPHFINIGDDVFADDTINPKYGDLVIHHEQNHGTRIKVCFYTPEIEATRDTAHVVTQITKHTDDTREQRLAHIEWNRVVSKDEVGAINDDLRGISVLLDGLACAETLSGSMIDQKHAFNVLNKVVFNTIKDLDSLENHVAYMHSTLTQTSDK